MLLTGVGAVILDGMGDLVGDTVLGICYFLLHRTCIERISA